ncbi:hypothetical protein [Nocardioides jejuensis]|uniref:Uncharacterized protein n=1 Tax=Nocardioides jejuensis TaxID=2502782 RepID=A0A4V2NZQ2_9ACTN|nr:hypothetical protein [Nocardioides jejuensis]TCJ29922.1 hypothetical protein EPD65_06385 [Nocardioides jejuensis]
MARIATALLAFAALVLVGVSARPAEALASAGGGFRPITAFRLAYTSDGTGGYSTPIGAGVTRSYQILGKGGIPTSDVSAVVVDVAVFDATADSGIRVWNYDASMPSATMLRFGPSMDRSNTVIVPVGPSGKISMWNQSGAAKYNIDVQGYFTSTSDSSTTGGFTPVAPFVRVVDSGQLGISDTNLVANKDYDVQVTGGQIPSTATAVFANVKVGGGGGADGGLRLGPGGTDISTLPAAVNFQGSGWTDSGVTIKLSSTGKLRVRNATVGASPYIYIDVEGYFEGSGTGGGGFKPLAQGLISDTIIPAGQKLFISPEGMGGLPTDGSLGTIAGTVTVLNWGGAGGVSVSPTADQAISSTNLSWNGTMSPSAGISTTALIGTDPDGTRFEISNSSPDSVLVRIAAQGYFVRDGFVDPPAPEASEAGNVDPSHGVPASTTVDLPADQECIDSTDYAGDKSDPDYQQFVRDECTYTVDTSATSTLTNDFTPSEARLTARDGTSLAYASRNHPVAAVVYAQSTHGKTNTWKVEHEVKAYYDADGRVWSDKTMYGKRGYHNCGEVYSYGASISTVRCDEVYRDDLYSQWGHPISEYYKFKRSLFFKGFPMSRVDMIHVNCYPSGECYSHKD